ncbi:hypothetical protein A2U01_0065120, partial [Trifolium medium]|nr:hypothetical protein [Trifolium medium]
LSLGHPRNKPIVTLSTTEAEFVAAASCACQGIWLRNVLNHMKIMQEESTVIYCDNSSSIKLSIQLCMADASILMLDITSLEISLRMV